MTRVSFVVVFLLVGALAVPPASAQFCPPGDEICRAQSGIYNMLDSNRHRGWVRQGRADVETFAYQMIRHPSLGWGYYAGGGFVPTPGYTGGGRAARVGRAVERGATGALIGYGVSGTARGAAIGGGIGFAADVVMSALASRSSGGSKTRKIDCSKKRLSREDRETCAAVEAEQEVAERAAEIQSNPVWHFNHTMLQIIVYDGDPARGGIEVCNLDAKWNSACRSGQSRNGGFVGLIQVYDPQAGRYTSKPASVRPSADRGRQGNVYLVAPGGRRGGV